MEKLIELLNEYGTQKQANANWKEFLEDDKNQIYLIFGMDFIKWLVENDKIDYKKLHGEEWYYKLIDSCDYNGEKRCEVLLMLLSIQDEPIEFLVSILK